MNENIFNVIVLLIPVFGAIITGFVVPYLKAKIGNEKLITIAKWVAYAVKAAEMIFTAEKAGVDKKKYVIDFIKKLFNKKKTVITDEQLDVLIEATVAEMNKNK